MTRPHRPSEKKGSPVNKPGLKATVLDHIVETVLTVATIAVAVTLNRLFPTPADDFQVVAIVAVAFIAWFSLSNLMTASVGPVIDRLRSQAAADTEGIER